MQKIVIIVIIAIALVTGCTYACYKNGYSRGYKVGYDAGYKAGYAERNALAETKEPEVRTVTETKVVYKEVPYNGNDVQVTTEKPKVTIAVNGKKQELKQTTATADLAVKTEAKIDLKIPERKWVVGIGTDGHDPALMLKAPLSKNGAVGIWGAGTRKKAFVGLSVSF